MIESVMKCYENYLTLALQILIPNASIDLLFFYKMIKINLLNSEQIRLYFKRKWFFFRIRGFKKNFQNQFEK